jgi:hypothetical protein
MIERTERAEKLARKETLTGKIMMMVDGCLLKRRSYGTKDNGQNGANTNSKKKTGRISHVQTPDRKRISMNFF